MALLNASFEDAGALPGEAAHWTLNAVTSLEVIAGFGDDPEEAWEDFERWGLWSADFDELAAVRAFFNGGSEGYEAFEAAWANSLYLRELSPAQLVRCPFGGADVEGGETGWRNDTFALDWTDVLAAPAIFEGAPVEAFEARWRMNESYARAWAEVASSPALFNASAESVERFESAWASTTRL